MEIDLDKSYGFCIWLHSESVRPPFCSATKDLCSNLGEVGVENAVNDVNATPQDTKTIMNSLFKSEDFDDDEVELLDERMGCRTDTTSIQSEGVVA